MAAFDDSIELSVKSWLKLCYDEFVRRKITILQFKETDEKFMTDKHFSPPNGKNILTDRTVVSDDGLMVRKIYVSSTSGAGSLGREVLAMDSLADVEGVQKVVAVYINLKDEQFALYTRFAGFTFREFLEKVAKNDFREEVTSHHYACLIMNLATTLDEIHKKGIVHHDIRGDNVTVYFDQEAGWFKGCFIDFGSCNVDVERAKNINDSLPGTNLLDRDMRLFVKMICDSVRHEGYNGALNYLTDEIDTHSKKSFQRLCSGAQYRQGLYTPLDLYNLLADVYN